MFKVICIKEASFNVSPHPSKIEVGGEYHVIRIFTDPLFGDYYFLEEDLPTQGYAAECFVRCDGPDERELFEERAQEEIARLDKAYAEIDEARAFVAFDEEAHDRIWAMIEAKLNADLQ